MFNLKKNWILEGLVCYMILCLWNNVNNIILN